MVSYKRGSVTCSHTPTLAPVIVLFNFLSITHYLRTSRDKRATHTLARLVDRVLSCGDNEPLPPFPSRGGGILMHVYTGCFGFVVCGEKGCGPLGENGKERMFERPG